MIVKLKKLGKDTVVYGVGDIVVKGLGFFLLPILTRIFTPAEYGNLEMLLVMSNLMAVVLNMGMEGAQSFYFFEAKKESRNTQASMVSAILQWRIIWGIFVVIASTLFSVFLLNKAVFKNGISWIIFAIVFSATLFMQIMYQTAEVFRLLFKPWPYIFLTLSSVSISTAMIIVTVVFMRLGILGYFIGILIGAIITAILGLCSVCRYLDWSILHWRLWPTLLGFGLPLFLSNLLTYILNTSDRWFINYYLSAYELGIYAVGAKLALITTLVIQAFMKSFLPFSLDELHSSDKAESDRVLEFIFRYYSGISLSVIVILTAFSTYIVKIASKGFFDAYKIIGILSLSAVFFGGTYFSCLGSWKVKKTYLYSLSALLACVLGIAMDISLIPSYGIMGASCASAIAMFALVCVSFYFSQRVWRIRFNFRVVIVQLTACIIYIALSLRFFTDRIFNKALIFLMTIAALGLIIAFTIKKEEWGKIFLIVKGD